MENKINVTATTHPFKAKNKQFVAPEGSTICEIIDSGDFHCSKEDILVRINGEPIKDWSIKPKAGNIIELRAFPVPTGGGGGKNVLRVILTIAVVALAVWTGGLAAGFLGLKAGTLAYGMTAGLVGGLVTAVGTLAINALVPLPQPKLGQLSGSDLSESPTLYISGARNSINPFGVVPVVLGKYRVTPPLGCKAFSEVIGDGQYVRMLFVWGVGPLSIDLSSICIGETPISEFEEVQMEHKEGYSLSEKLTLFPNAVSQEDFSILLKQVNGWTTRTSTINADELSVDISFPQGLLRFDNNGHRQNQSVNLEIEYKPVASSVWQKIDTSHAGFLFTGAGGSLNITGDLLDSITCTQQRSASIRHGIKWVVDTRGQYDVRVRRMSVDTDSTQIMDFMYWTALKTITNEDPISAPLPLAKTALLIKATDQLNGIVDTFNALVTTVCLDWDKYSGTWVRRATQNPASLYRCVLQGGAMAKPLPNSRVDLESLQEWHEFCEERGFKFNMVRDFEASVWDTLKDVAAAGRAAPAPIDGKWGVVIDRPQSIFKSIITPRNSFGFSAQKFFIDLCHGWRIQFPNEKEGYNFDERRVYRDGYNDNNATVFESLELAGVTDPDQIYKLGRYRIAQGLSQMERWTFKQDLEFITYNRGDKIAISHDVMLVGLAYGRINAIYTDESNHITGVGLDEPVVMESGKEYGIAVRNVNNPKISAKVVVDVGETSSIDFQTPIAPIGGQPAIDIGDIFSFGIFGEEVEEAIVIAITPYNDFKAEIVCVPYRESVYNADTENIPEFTTTITPLVAISQPVVKAIISDESAMLLMSTGQVKQRLLIAYEPLSRDVFGQDVKFEIQMRPSSTRENFYDAPIESSGDGFVYIGDIQTGEVFDIRMRFVVPYRLPGKWNTISDYIIVGRSTPPAPLKNMTISVFGGQALIRWDKPDDLDVLFGGEVVFRHSEDFDNPLWSGSVTIGQAARARTLFAVLPLKAGVYMARVYDVDGNISEEVTSVDTKQASVHRFVSVDVFEENPYFLGDMDNIEQSNGDIRIAEGSPYKLEGTYYFAQGVDLGNVSRVRVTTNIALSSYNKSDLFDSRTSFIDSWEDFDGTLQAVGDARTFVRHTDDDPNDSPEWSAWERLDSAEFEARGFEFKTVLSVVDDEYNVLVSRLGITIDEVV